MTELKPLSKAVPVLCFLLWFPCLRVFGQDVTNPLNVGFPANGEFSGSDFDNVQINNGNLHIEIPVWSDKGRGLGVSLKYIYDNKGWTATETCDKLGFCNAKIRMETGGSTVFKLLGPFGYSVTHKTLVQVCSPGTSNLTFLNYVLREPNGTKHLFGPSTTTPGGNVCWAALGTTLYSADGLGYVLHVSNGSDGQGQGVVESAVRKDGTLSLGTIKDANGNELIPGIYPNPNLDTLGRAINTDGSYYDTSGTLRSTQITYQSVAIQTALCGFYQDNTCTEYSGTYSLPQVFTLPNGMTYTFSYDQGSPTHPYYGEPLSVTLPTGGTITWGWSANADVAGRFVISRQLSGDPNPWAYTPCLGSVVGSTSTGKITDPAGNDTVITCTYFFFPYSQPGSDGIAYVTKKQLYQGSSTSGQLLKTIQTDWVNAGALVPAHETTTWNPQNLVSRVETDYDLYTGWTDNQGSHSVTGQNPIERREYAFGSGTWGSQVRTTHYNYLHLTNSTYLNANMVDLPTSKVVYNGSSQSGTIVAQTTYTYDGVTTTSTSGTPAPNHDYSGFSTSNNIRGNLTQTSQGLKVGSTWTWLNTTHTYDDLGNVLTTKDPNLDQTSFSYLDSWADANCTLGTNTFAYITKTTDALSHQTTHSYFRCMGLLASTKDQNDINNSGTGTTFTYDLMNRPLIVSSPDGGQTTSSYVDTAPLTVTQQKLVGTGASIQHASVFDGLGRLQQTQFKDPDCTTGSALVKVDHAYGFTAGTGEFTQVSTPYCDTPNSIYGLMAKTQHDALDRITTVTQTDGSTVSTTYSGTTAGLTATVTDEAGKARKSLTDALGHLTTVWEDPGGLNYETGYGYDTLDSLTSVTQQGGASSGSWRKRSFTYDSLGRLKCAANPEVTSSVNSPSSCPAADTGSYTPGTIGYTYDADGNVVTKTAPAPNQTGTASTAVTNYSYDTLNRLTQKSYSGGAATATVQYAFDGNSMSNCVTGPPSLSPADANPILYRTAMCDGSGATAWSHDSMGRVLTEQKIINGATAINNAIKYTYYKDGELNTLTYPAGNHKITYTANSLNGFSAGRIKSAVDTANSINYVTSATYAPQGALASLTNGASILGAFSYNSRLQPLQMYYGTNSPPSLTGSTCPGTVGNILHRIYNFSVGANDNGNVISITNCRDTNRTQNVTYDSLNRITAAATQGTTCTSCWGQRFGHLSGSTFVPGIDAWGNLFEITATQGSPTTLSQGVTLNNQFLGMTYDASGNLINDGGGHTYTFDDENRLTATAGYTYVYDADGKRVKKCSNSGCTTGTIYWTGTSSDTISEAGVGGSITEEYIFFNGKRVARRDASNGAVHYYFSDHLKSADVITSNLGAIQEESDYFPYGGEKVVTGSDINNYKFTGKERDAESGLDYFDARHYANAWGRFMQPDWAAAPTEVPYANFGNPQSLNLYSYVENNPTTLGDPDGHELKVDPALLQAVNQLRAESPSFNSELRAHEGTTNPNLAINHGATPLDADGKTPSTGSTQASLDNNPLVTIESYKGSTVTVNDSVMGDTSQIQDVLGHEVAGHVHDYRTNTQQAWNDSQYTNQHQGKTPGCESNCHDKRPEEQRAIKANEQVKVERKEYQQQQKELKKEQKREEKRLKKAKKAKNS